MTYLKCRWDEPRADIHGDWGCSWWFFELDPDGSVVRQVEVYDYGVRVRYDRDHLGDEFGKLGEGCLDEMYMPGAERLSANQFEVVWESVRSNGIAH
jgi:hypothetical protein